jgi:hypothetical protein
MDGKFGNGRLFHCGRGARVVKSRGLHRVRLISWRWRVPVAVVLIARLRFAPLCKSSPSVDQMSLSLSFEANFASRSSLLTACIDPTPLAPRWHRTRSCRNAIGLLWFRHGPFKA